MHSSFPADTSVIEFTTCEFAGCTTKFVSLLLHPLAFAFLSRSCRITILLSCWFLAKRTLSFVRLDFDSFYGLLATLTLHWHPFSGYSKCFTGSLALMNDSRFESISSMIFLIRGCALTRSLVSFAPPVASKNRTS